MSIKIIQDRLQSYDLKSKQDEINAIKEIYQEIALVALSRSGFFKIAAFQGGTCLRILYSLNRFSEDLDFVLINPSKDFVWHPFLKNMEEEFLAYGLNLETIDRSKVSCVVQKAFLKQDSFGKLLQLEYQRSVSDKLNITIRLEIDTNPPDGSQFSTHYLDFPQIFPIVAQDKESLFASKCHALICRSYVKGRDWFDFLWYVSRKTSINFDLLKSALIQTGHWDKQQIFTKDNFLDLLKKKVLQISWDQAALDAANFLKSKDREMLSYWSTNFFLEYIAKLDAYLVSNCRSS